MLVLWVKRVILDRLSTEETLAGVKKENRKLAGADGGDAF